LLIHIIHTCKFAFFISKRGGWASGADALARLYEKKGEQKDAEEEYEECLKKMGKAPAQEEIAALTNAFVKRDLYSWAIKTIEKARKLYNDNNNEKTPAAHAPDAW